MGESLWLTCKASVAYDGSGVVGCGHVSVKWFHLWLIEAGRQQAAKGIVP